MSDQASSRKLFNSLVEERLSAERDTAESATTDSETVEAERDTAEGVATERDAEKHASGSKFAGCSSQGLSGSPPSVDSLVHSACKLPRHLGTNSEYGWGVQAFSEYIKALLEEAEAVADTVMTHKS